jgi:Sec-independent protein translocase protein TatA
MIISGPNKSPEQGNRLGKTMREFKKELCEIDKRPDKPPGVQKTE